MPDRGRCDVCLDDRPSRRFRSSRSRSWRRDLRLRSCSHFIGCQAIPGASRSRCVGFAVWRTRDGSARRCRSIRRLAGVQSCRPGVGEYFGFDDLIDRQVAVVMPDCDCVAIESFSSAGSKAFRSNCSFSESCRLLQTNLKPQSPHR
jgi:hypothetical protein